MSKPIADDSTVVFSEGIPMEPVDTKAELPSPPVKADPGLVARCYVRAENAFYVWNGGEWQRRL